MMSLGRSHVSIQARATDVQLRRESGITATLILEREFFPNESSI